MQHDLARDHDGVGVLTGRSHRRQVTPEPPRGREVEVEQCPQRHALPRRLGTERLVRLHLPAGQRLARTHRRDHRRQEVAEQRDRHLPRVGDGARRDLGEDVLGDRAGPTPRRHQLVMSLRPKCQNAMPNITAAYAIEVAAPRDIDDQTTGVCNASSQANWKCVGR